MQTLAETLGANVNDDGIWQVADETTRGCPFCGAVEVTASEYGNFIWWHAGAECCTDRITQQIGWRENEALDIEAHIQAVRNRPNELRKQAEYAGSRHEAQRLTADADKADRNMSFAVRALEDKLKTVIEEQAELKRKRARL